MQGKCPCTSSPLNHLPDPENGEFSLVSDWIRYATDLFGHSVENELKEERSRIQTREDCCYTGPVAHHELETYTSMGERIRAWENGG